MFIKELPYDLTWMLGEGYLDLHPLIAISGNLRSCANVLDECIEKNLSRTFLYDLARSAEMAANAIYELLGVSVYPMFHSETKLYPKRSTSHKTISPYPIRDGNMKQADGKFKSIELSDNSYVTWGREQITDIQDGVNVEYFDLDGDGFREVAIVTLDLGATPEYDICEIHAYNGDVRATGEVTRSLVGTVLTLTMNSWDLIDPAYLTPTLLETVFDQRNASVDLCCTFDGNNYPVDPCPFLTTIDVKRYHINKVACGGRLWYVGDSCSCGNDGCITTSGQACVTETGICNTIRLAPAECEIDETAIEPYSLTDVIACNALTSCTCQNEPDYADVSYLGGSPEAYTFSLEGCDNGEPCFNPDALCFKDAWYWLTLAWLQWKDCDCNYFYQIEEAQQVDIDLSGDFDDDKYRTIVRLNRKGEQIAWGILKSAMIKGRYRYGKCRMC